MNCDQIFAQVKRVFTDSLAAYHIAVTGAFGAQEIVGRLRGAQLVLAIGQAQDNLTIKANFYIPIELGCEICEQAMTAADTILRGEMEGYERCERVSTGYDTALRAYAVKWLLRLHRLSYLEYGGGQLAILSPALRVRNERMLKKFYAPMIGEIVQDLGKRARIVTGRGFLGGEEQGEQFAVIQELYETDGAQLLCLPSDLGFQAVFSSLLYWNENGCTYYDFEFTEVPAI